MIGEVDEPGGVEASGRLAASVADARRAEFPGVAHMIHLEAPERFNRLVLDLCLTTPPQRTPDLGLECEIVRAGDLQRPLKQRLLAQMRSWRPAPRF